MTFQSTKFDMSGVMNRLRAIAEAGEEHPEHMDAPDPGMETGGREIDNAAFTRTMQRLAAIKDAVAEEHYNALKAGIRAMYMNRRPNLQQMTALMDLLETVLAYVAQDNSLFQRLKNDLSKDKTAAPEQPADVPPEQEPAAGPSDVKMAGAPETQKSTAAMRPFK